MLLLLMAWMYCSSMVAAMPPVKYLCGMKASDIQTTSWNQAWQAVAAAFTVGADKVSLVDLHMPETTTIIRTDD
jgi:hypothetical protein